MAGPIAGDVFAIGLLASSILAVPVLAASSAYILGSELGWRKGLSQRVGRAWRFYAAIAALLVVAVAVSFLGISPIQLLFVSGIIGGLGTPISLAFLLLVARNERLMRDHGIGKLLTIAGWTIAILVSLVSVYFLWQQFGSNL